MPDLLATVETLKALAGAIPQLRARDTEYISLRSDDDYALYDGDICSTRHRPGARQRVPEDDQRVRRAAQHEQALPRSTGPATWSGALARWNNNHDRLCDLARDGGRDAGPEAGLLQPLHEHHRPGGRGGPLRHRCDRDHRQAAGRRA